MIDHDLIHVLHTLETLHVEGRDTDEAISRVLGRLPPHLRQQFNDRFIKAETVRETLQKVLTP